MFLGQNRTCGTVSKVTDASVKVLKEFKGLEYLDLEGTAVTKAGLKELAAALPECEIVAPDQSAALPD